MIKYETQNILDYLQMSREELLITYFSSLSLSSKFEITEKMLATSNQSFDFYKHGLFNKSYKCKINLDIHENNKITKALRQLNKILTKVNKKIQNNNKRSINILNEEPSYNVIKQNEININKIQTEFNYLMKKSNDESDEKMTIVSDVLASEINNSINKLEMNEKLNVNSVNIKKKFSNQRLKEIAQAEIELLRIERASERDYSFIPDNPKPKTTEKSFANKTEINSKIFKSSNGSMKATLLIV